MAMKETPKEYSPEQLKKIYAKMQKSFTPEMLIEYIEDDAPTNPIEDVLKMADDILAERLVSRRESR